MPRPEATDYLRKAKERLRAGKILLKENLHDDASSRAYYAALSAAKAALVEEELAPKSHDGAIRLFAAHFIKNGRLPKALGVDLTRLRTMREKAEYSPAHKVTLEDAEWALEAANRFVKTVEKFLK